MPEPSASPQTLLDHWIPQWQFEERHSLAIRGTPGQISAAVREITPGEIPLVQLMMRIRQPFARRTATVKPILEAARHELFLNLEDTPHELVMGLAGRFWTPSGGRVRLNSKQEFKAFKRPGYAKAAVNFRILPLDAGRSLLTTETRVVTYGRSATLKFGLYWWLAVRWGSGWIRVLWLRAIRARVEHSA